MTATTATATTIEKTVLEIRIDSGGASGQKGKMREKETVMIVTTAAGSANASGRTLVMMRTSRLLRAVRCRHHSIKLKIPLNPPLLKTTSLSLRRGTWIRPLFTIHMFNNNFQDSFQPLLLSLTDRQTLLVKRPITMATKDSLSKTNRAFDQSHRWLFPTARRT